MPPPIVSIIICTCNRAGDLRQTLAALAGLRVPDSLPAEVVVVDNGSTDSTADVVKTCVLENMLEHMRVRYVSEPRRGKGYAYNRGMAEAAGGVFLFTDDDVRPPADWIAGMTEPILSGKADAVAGGVRIAPQLEREWMDSDHRCWLASTEWIEAPEAQSMIGANMAFSRRVLEKVPGFDTELGPGALGFFDETLFTWQLQEAGFKLVSAFDVCVEHHFDADRLSRGSFLSSAKKMGESEAFVRYHWRHEDEKSLRRQFLNTSLRNFVWRLRTRKNEAEGLPLTRNELHRVYTYWLLKKFLHERAKPRKYARHGLSETKANG